MNKIVTILASMALVVSMASCTEEQTTVQEVEKVEKVQVMKLATTEIEREVILPTTLEGYDNMKVSSSVSGIIDEILVKVGDRVSKGQLLVKMDPTQYTTTKLTYANLGVEWFFMKNVSLGATVDITPLMVAFQPQTYTTYEGFDKYHNQVAQYNDLVSPGSCYLLYGTDNIGVNISFHYYF